MNPNSLTNIDFSPAAERNRQPIWALMSSWITKIKNDHQLEQIDCLEIASGTGQHSAFFASQCKDLIMWPSDQSLERATSIMGWAQASQVSEQVRPLHLLDVSQTEQWPKRLFPVIYCANMVHISPWSSAQGLFKGAGEHLVDQGILIMYGPYRFENQELAPSNQAFDISLKQRNPLWGIRDLSALDELAQQAKLKRVNVYDCPANNHLLVFQKEE